MKLLTVPTKKEIRLAYDEERGEYVIIKLYAKKSRIVDKRPTTKYETNCLKVVSRKSLIFLINFFIIIICFYREDVCLLMSLLA